MSHNPYIMPDGGRRGDGRIARDEIRRKGTRDVRTGKQEQADAVALQRAQAEGLEAVELAAIASVGVRRRRRW